MKRTLLAAIILCAPFVAQAKNVNLPGTSKIGAILCGSPAQVGYDLKPGCIQVDDGDNLKLQVLEFNGSTTKVRMGGKILHALSIMILVTYKGIDMSVYSYVTRQFPPGVR